MSGSAIDWTRPDLLLGKRFATDFTVLWIGPPRRRGDVGTVGIEMDKHIYTISIDELHTLLDAGFVREVKEEGANGGSP
jgi:hypothetical protein